MPDSDAMLPPESSAFRASGSLEEKIERARLELLDLSTRNRLLHTPRGGRAKTVEVVGELATAIYETLITNGKRFTFAPGRADPATETSEEEAPTPEDVEDASLSQPDEELDEHGRRPSQWDTSLQTRMTSGGLQKRLLDLYLDARTLEEEQGVNILYLAIGFLKWRATSTPNQDRFGPLVLIPVRLERSNAGDKLHLRWSGDDLQTNLSLQLYLRREFGMVLPDIDCTEGFDVQGYLDEVAELVRNRPNWEVLTGDAVLGLFSFAKFMMYRDLEKEQWAACGGFQSRQQLRGVVADGFPGECLSDEDANIDDLVPPAKMVHVVDSDSSQTLVIHDVSEGRSMLVQGPPGTGKSQTITNIIAAAVNAKKRVLFMAEKMAALDVVKRRLDAVELGGACLELHSHKAQKRILLEELNRTWLAGRPPHQDGRGTLLQLKEVRDFLNAHAERLHRSLEPAGLSAFDVFGHLVRLRRQGHTTGRVDLEAPSSWTSEEVDSRQAMVADLAGRIEAMGLPDAHPWAGVGIRGLLPNDRDRLIEDVTTTSDALAEWVEQASALTSSVDLAPPDRLCQLDAVTRRLEVLLTTPSIGADALAHEVWEEMEEVRRAVESLSEAQRLKTNVAELADGSALTVDWQTVRDELRQLLPTFVLGTELSTLAHLHASFERLVPDATRLAQLFAVEGPLTLDDVAHVCALGGRAASVPMIDRSALVARVWDMGVDTVDDLIETVDRLQVAKAKLAGVFRDAAWQQDLESSRTAIAANNGNLFRFFNSEWRAAKRAVRAVLVSPKQRPEDVLANLDCLIEARSAQKSIGERDLLGQEAFGAAWERERSDVELLRGVVAWMRSLRPLGASAREKLADVADRELATELSKRLAPLLEEVRSQLLPLSEAMVAAGLRPWGEETVIRRVPIDVLRASCGAWKDVYESCAALVNREALTVSETLTVIEQIQFAQDALRTLEANNATGLAAFGDLWMGVGTSLSHVRDALHWMQEHVEIRHLAARFSEAELALGTARSLQSRGSDLVGGLLELFSRLDFSRKGALTADPRPASLDELTSLLSQWRRNPEALQQWVSYQARAADARASGLGDLVDRMAGGDVASQDAVGLFWLSYYEAVLAALVAREPLLAQFDGERQKLLVDEFSRLDHDRMAFARFQVQATHHARLPPRAGATGPTALLLGEMAKKRGHMPIRQLMTRCGAAIQALKPVFMMSPMSIAQFLPPGDVEFDVLIIDEASQVQPVDALGAIARSNQLVIVGDERQLPPTRFFAKVTGEVDENKDSDETDAGDVESILGLCRARGLPDRMLQWHYRSRHESLIAVSNSQFYENKLLIIPSPYSDVAGLGLKFHHVSDGVYDRGGTSTNTLEARAVARAVVEHAARSPHESLGVAAFSTQQRRAIFDEVEVLRRQNPETERFFNAHPDEPFFVKSLENVQGDERDVIYISVGYGRDANGQMTMNFGPLGKQGGERRLNVLISRAKSRCEVFSSITDEDIDLDRTQGKGTAAFKLFLRFARTKSLAVHDSREVGVGERVFEEEVATALREKGYVLDTGVGIAGLFVDIAVADPSRPGRYVLAIECDGDWYGRARSARDRDRLRTQALKSKGWRVHRIWASDWFQRPVAELERAVSAVEAALEAASTSMDVLPIASARPLVGGAASDAGTATDNFELPYEEVRHVAAYEEAAFSVPNHKFELHLTPPDVMAEVVREVVAVEGPIHRAEVIARVRDLWGVQRAGSRIQAAVEAGIRQAHRQRHVEISHGEFLTIPHQSVEVRDRSDVLSLSLRRPDYLPPQEIDAAVLAIVNANFGATTAELVLHVARQLGYKSTSAQLRTVIEDRVRSVIREGLAVMKDDLVCSVG